MSTRIRHRGLLALSLALLGGSGALAYVLEHDAVGETPALARAAPGEAVSVKGTLQAFLPPADARADGRTAAAWSRVLSQLDNVTYRLATDATPDDVLVTAEGPGPGPGAAAVVHGEVLLRIRHPDGSGRDLVLIGADSLEPPLVFR